MYLQIFLLATPQIMSCSCKVRTMSLCSLVSSCPWTGDDPFTKACVHDVKAWVDVHDNTIMRTRIGFMGKDYRLCSCPVRSHSCLWALSQGNNCAWACYDCAWGYMIEDPQISCVLLLEYFSILQDFIGSARSHSVIPICCSPLVNIFRNHVKW